MANKWLYAFALISFALFLPGCIQPAVPDACKSLQGNKFTDCIYRSAVLEQNPFLCYSIEDIDQRSICLRHATNPAMKAQVQYAMQEENKPSAKEVPDSPPTQLPPSETFPQEEGNCFAKSGEQRDNCLRDEALASKDLLGCEKIDSFSIRTSCIAKVAMASRNLEKCNELSDEQSRNLCRTYAKGENPAQ
ncbi:MAG: hypothetical protein QW275_00905 [Candidatus Anstonellaceae archaeon]